MNKAEFERLVCSLDGDALEVLGGEMDGLDANSPFNPGPEEMGLDEVAGEEEIEESLMSNYFYNFDVEVKGSTGMLDVRGTFAVVDGYVERIERLTVCASDGTRLPDDSPEMSSVYDQLAELLRND